MDYTVIISSVACSCPLKPPVAKATIVHDFVSTTHRGSQTKKGELVTSSGPRARRSKKLNFLETVASGQT